MGCHLGHGPLRLEARPGANHSTRLKETEDSFARGVVKYYVHVMYCQAGNGNKPDSTLHMYYTNTHTVSKSTLNKCKNRNMQQFQRYD